jgi:hypothetical protein
MTLTFVGNHGSLEVDFQTGKVLSVRNDPSTDETYNDIIHFDLKEMHKNYKRKVEDGHTIDILLAGFWTEANEYIKAEDDYRRECERLRVWTNPNPNPQRKTTMENDNLQDPKPNFNLSSSTLLTIRRTPDFWQRLIKSQVLPLLPYRQKILNLSLDSKVKFYRELSQRLKEHYE